MLLRLLEGQAGLEGPKLRAGRGLWAPLLEGEVGGFKGEPLRGIEGSLPWKQWGPCCRQ